MSTTKLTPRLNNEGLNRTQTFRTKENQNQNLPRTHHELDRQLKKWIYKGARLSLNCSQVSSDPLNRVTWEYVTPGRKDLPTHITLKV